jgi:hypothetical protein
VKRLSEMLVLENRGMASWTLHHLLRETPDLASVILETADSYVGVKRLVLLSYSGPDRLEEVWREIDTMANGGLPESDLSSISLWELVNVNWQNHTESLLALLRQPIPGLAYHVIEAMGIIVTSEPPTWQVSFSPIEEWLEVMERIYAQGYGAEKDEDAPFFSIDRLAAMIVHNGMEQDWIDILNLFNTETCRSRSIIAEVFLHKLPAFTTQVLTEEASEFLLSEISRNPSLAMMMANSVTEDFVLGGLLPLARSLKGELQLKLLESIRHVGERHRRRYLTDREHSILVRDS